MVNYETGGYKLKPTIGWNGRIGVRASRSFINSLENHKPTQA